MAKQPGLDDRHRDENGQTREKNGNTRIDTLRETYGDEFGAGLRSDTHLRTLLDRTGSSSLSDYLRNQKKEPVTRVVWLSGSNHDALDLIEGSFRRASGHRAASSGCWLIGHGRDLLQRRLSCLRQHLQVGGPNLCRSAVV